MKLFKSLESKGMKDVLSEGIGKNRIKIENSVDMRYMGQAHELNLPFKKSFIDDFHKLHKRSYGYCKSGLFYRSSKYQGKGNREDEKTCDGKKAERFFGEGPNRMAKRRSVFSGENG